MSAHACVAAPDNSDAALAPAAERVVEALVATVEEGGSRAAAFEAGFDAHIVKPASADKIMRAATGQAVKDAA